MNTNSFNNDEMDNSGEDFEDIYQSNESVIYRFMFWRTRDKMIAEDLTGTVFEKAWKSRNNFKGGSSKAWLLKIARNTLIDYWRKKQDYSLSDNDSLVIESNVKPIEEKIDNQIMINDLTKAYNKLPNEMRIIIKLRFIDRRSVKEISLELGLSEANVRVIQYRALRKLRGYLK